MAPLPSASSDLVRTTEHGLWCELGGFHIDPWKPVDRAIVTHAHADHTRPGSLRYLSSERGADLVRQRTSLAVHGPVRVEAIPYG